MLFGFEYHLCNFHHPQYSISQLVNDNNETLSCLGQNLDPPVKPNHCYTARGPRIAIPNYNNLDLLWLNFWLFH